MKTVRIRFKQHGIHTHMRVFVGETGKTLGKAGDLVMRPDEANAFFTALQVGPNGPIGSDMPVEIGLDEDAVSAVPVFEVKERNPFIEGPARTAAEAGYTDLVSDGGMDPRNPGAPAPGPRCRCGHVYVAHHEGGCSMCNCPRYSNWPAPPAPAAKDGT